MAQILSNSDARIGLACAFIAGTGAVHAAPAWTFRIDASFTDISAYEPQGKLTLGPDGSMYGTTDLSSDPQSGTCGSVYRVDASGNLTTLHAFNDFWQGCQPMGALLLAADGWLYGTTNGGGTYQWGTLFRISADGTFELLHSFDPTSDGTGSSQAALVQGSDGTFYGTGGDLNGQGTVFAFDPTSGGVKVLHTFPGGVEGNYPDGVTFGSDQRLYGTTMTGGTGGWGLLYALTTTGEFTVLHNFNCATDGCSPQGALVVGRHGALYGTTQTGGYGWGSIFRYGKAGFQVVHVFSPASPEGARPGHEVSLDGRGHLYGVTQLGASGFGTLYRIDATDTLSVIYTFTGGADGGEPWTGPSIAANGDIIGVTLVGGAAGLGTVYEVGNFKN